MLQESSGRSAPGDSTPLRTPMSSSDSDSTDTESISPWDMGIVASVHQVDDVVPHVTMTEASMAKRIHSPSTPQPPSQPSPKTNVLPTSMAKVSPPDVVRLKAQLRNQECKLAEKDEAIKVLQARNKKLEDEIIVARQELAKQQKVPEVHGDGFWKAEAERCKAQAEECKAQTKKYKEALAELQLRMFRKDEGGATRSAMAPAGTSPRHVGLSTGCGEKDDLQPGAVQKNTGWRANSRGQMGNAASSVCSSPCALSWAGRNTGRASPPQGTVPQGHHFTLADLLQSQQGSSQQPARSGSPSQHSLHGRGDAGDLLNTHSMGTTQAAPAFASAPQPPPQFYSQESRQTSPRGTNGQSPLPELMFQQLPLSPQAPGASWPESTSSTQPQLNVQYRAQGFESCSPAGPGQASGLQAQWAMSPKTDISPQMAARPHDEGYARPVDHQHLHNLGEAESPSVEGQFGHNGGCISPLLQQAVEGYQSGQIGEPSGDLTHLQQMNAVQGLPGRQGGPGMQAAEHSPNSSLLRENMPQRMGSVHMQAPSTYPSPGQNVHGWPTGPNFQGAPTPTNMLADQVGYAGQPSGPQMNASSLSTQSPNSGLRPGLTHSTGPTGAGGQGIPALGHVPGNQVGHHGQVVSEVPSGGQGNAQMVNVNAQPLQNLQGGQWGTGGQGMTSLSMLLSSLDVNDGGANGRVVQGQHQDQIHQLHQRELTGQGIDSPMFTAERNGGYSGQMPGSDVNPQMPSMNSQPTQNLQTGLPGAGTQGVASPAMMAGTQVGYGGQTGGGAANAQIFPSPQAAHGLQPEQGPTSASKNPQGSQSTFAGQTYGRPSTSSAPIGVVLSSQALPSNQEDGDTRMVGSPSSGSASLAGYVSDDVQSGRGLAGAQGSGNWGVQGAIPVGQPLASGSGPFHRSGRGGSQDSQRGAPAVAHSEQQMGLAGLQESMHSGQNSLVPTSSPTMLGSQFDGTLQMQQTLEAQTQGRPLQEEGLFILGGRNPDDKKVTMIEKFIPSNRQWQTIAKWEENGSPKQGCVVHSSGETYIIGGEYHREWRFSPSIHVRKTHVNAEGAPTGQWRMVNMLVHGRACHAAAPMASGGLMVGGGAVSCRANSHAKDAVLELHEVRATNTVELYDCARDIWRTGPSLSVPRYGLAITRVDATTFFAVGGVSSEGILVSTAEMIDLRENGNRWVTVVSMPTPRAFFGCCCLHWTTGSGVWAIGGVAPQAQGSGVATTNCVEHYDFRMRKWVSWEGTKETRAFCTAQAINGTVYAIGGLKDLAATPNKMVGMEVYQMGSTRGWQPGLLAGGENVRAFHGSYVG
eukprot:evm.model.scf_497.2 EVM.evm.TU.scf_497.2   scf_497:35100-41442(+)